MIDGVQARSLTIPHTFPRNRTASSAAVPPWLMTSSNPAGTNKRKKEIMFFQGLAAQWTGGTKA
jgi:hypothetical protein